MKKLPAYWTYDPEAHRAYYFAPCNRTPPPYKRQIEVTAILDIASDGTLAGVELVMGDLPPPPKLSAAGYMIVKVPPHHTIMIVANPHDPPPSASVNAPQDRS